VPKEIPKQERGEEVDTSSMIGIRPNREVGPMIRVKWQLFNWEHQPNSEVREVDIPEEITFIQFVEKHVQQLVGRISPQDRFRAGATLPTTITPGYMIKVEAKEIPSVTDALGLKLVATPFARKPTPVAGVRPRAPPAEDPKVRVYIKQEPWLVNSVDRWIDMSNRMAKKYGIPAWALFKLKPLDGDYEAQKPEGGLEVYAFDWKEGMQYWWSCEYDAFEDPMRQERKQVVIVDEEGHEEALAVYVNWGTAEIARHIHKIFAVHECKEVVVRETEENVYAWRLIRKQGAPEAKKLAIALGTKCLAVEMEERDNNTLGEWLSRKTGYIIPPLVKCQRTEGQIGHPKEPVKLWTGVTGVKTVQPTIRKKEHVLAFRVANKGYMSKPVECTFPYDLDEIMSVGHELSECIPEQPVLAEFPAQPWGHRVDIRVKRFRTHWDIRAPSGEQEEEAWRRRPQRRSGEESRQETHACRPTTK
jgi:hypothetical protein